jgi:hypothetical protein
LQSKGPKQDSRKPTLSLKIHLNNFLALGFAFRCKLGTALPTIKNTKKKNPHKNTPKNIHLNNFFKKNTQKKTKQTKTNGIIPYSY